VNLIKKLLFFIAKVSIFVIIIIVAGITGADWYFHDGQPEYYQSQYSIKVTNLSFYSGSVVTGIMVPIPRLNNEYAFSDTELQGMTFGSWKSDLVVSDEGKMLALQSTGANLSDLSATFSTPHRPIGNKRWKSENLSLTPVSQPDQTSGSQFLSSTTLVYLPEELKPLTENSPPVMVELEFVVLGDRIGSDTLDDFRLVGTGLIPRDIHGKIPLAVQSYTRKSIPVACNMTWLMV
jgi:hypothetical protein